MMNFLLSLATGVRPLILGGQGQVLYFQLRRELSKGVINYPDGPD
jgi:hypothetical protein